MHCRPQTEETQEVEATTVPESTSTEVETGQAPEGDVVMEEEQPPAAVQEEEVPPVQEEEGVAEAGEAGSFRDEVEALVREGECIVVRW